MTTREMLLFWAFVFGAVWGSFVAAAIWRTRNRISLGGVSRCPSCGTPVHPLENIPVVSWAILGGRTSCCGQKLSPLYNVLEFASGVLFCWLVAVYWPAALLLFAGGTGLMVLLNVFLRSRIGKSSIAGGTKNS